MKSKNPNTTKKIKKNLEGDKVQRVSRYLEDYQELFTFKMRPVTEAFIERLSQELMDWADKEESLVIEDFHDERKICSSTFYRWVDKHESMNKAHAYAKRRMMSKREKGMLTRKYDSTTAWNSLAKYDPVWEKFMEWKAALAKTQAENPVIELRVKDIRSRKAIEEDSDRQDKGESIIDV